MNKETQKQRILRLFAENGNILTLAQLMDKKYGLGSEYRARISELRKKYEILCTENKEDPNNNIYTLYGEIAEKAPVSPVEPAEKKTDYSSMEYKELVNRYRLLGTNDRIEMIRILQREYPENGIQYKRISEQVERLQCKP